MVKLKLALLIIFAFSFNFNLIESSSEEDATVNVLLVYEDKAQLKGFDLASAYIEKTKSLKIKVGSVYKVQASGTNATVIFKSLCNDVVEIHNKEGNEWPDLMIDLSQNGFCSVAIKSLAKKLAIPTISASLGPKGGISGWRNLSERKTHYLIRIAPPANILPYALPSIVHNQNLSNAVILPGYDKEYGLFLRVESTKKSNNSKRIRKMAINSRKYINQFYIDRFIHQKFTNFLVMGNPNKISQMLEIATDPEMTDGPYGNKSVWYSTSLQTELPTCSDCKSDISIIHFLPKIPTKGNPRLKFLKSKEYEVESLTDLFYFDFVANGILAVGKMKRDKSWVSPPKRMCNTKNKKAINYEVDLLGVLSLDEINGQNALGPFHMELNATAGINHAQFEMTMNLLKYVANQAEPTSNEVIGTWKAVFNSTGEIFTESHEDIYEGHLS